jgi:hypothetical protein
VPVVVWLPSSNSTILPFVLALLIGLLPNSWCKSSLATPYHYLNTVLIIYSSDHLLAYRSRALLAEERDSSSRSVNICHGDDTWHIFIERNITRIIGI